MTQRSPMPSTRPATTSSQPSKPGTTPGHGPGARGDEEMTTNPTGTEARAIDLELDISGMTCSSCANRIEKKLNKLEGVTATVNYATEKAKVTYPGSVTPEDLVAVVEKTGYGATIPA